MIKKQIKERILILDGAMGTSIQEFGLQEEQFRGSQFRQHPVNLLGNNDILNITNPDIIRSIHQSYIDAGADIIETNTFNSNAVSQEEYKCSDIIYELNLQGASIARKVADNAKRTIFVAGSVGPTSKTLSFSPLADTPQYRDLDFDTLANAYIEQIRGLVHGGIDLLIIETVFDGLNAKAALYAASIVSQEEGKEIPLILSATANDKSGRILTGQTLEALYTSVSHYPLLAFGLNCSFGATELYPIIERLSEILPCALSIYPNAGLPNELGQYDETPEYTASILRNMAKDGLLNIAGGCCGTTPAHIASIARALKDIPPRVAPQVQQMTTVSGLEKVVIDKKHNFTNIGERTNVAGSAKFARLIREKKYAEAAGIALKQIENGASIIDINMDDAMLNAPAEMENFLRYIGNEPDIAKVAFMVDSSDWNTLLSGLKNIQGKPIINSISLKEGENEFIQKASEIKRLGAAVVVMAFDEEEQAVSYERKTEICNRAYTLLTENVGFCPSDIIFDVNVLTIATGLSEHNNYAVDFIRAVKWIKGHLPYALTSAGVSNLSFAFRGNNTIREAMHSVFLYHAIRAGLDMAIVNPGMLQIYDDIDPLLLRAVEDVILNKDPQASERLTQLAGELKSKNENNEKEKIEKWRELPLDERLIYSLVKGQTEHLSADLKEALTIYKTPVKIIEGPLMRGMNRIGSLFEEGKMFLPQVVKSARIMKEAVAILQPELDKNTTQDSKINQQHKIVIATVKGDVHDIGKNIVNIVLSCNNIEVIDLGVMVDNTKIVEAAVMHQADIIGVSGLITPSLSEMENLCSLLHKKDMNTPLIVGGATTSSVHTAVKLAPKYKHGVIHGGDASKTVGIVKNLLSEREVFIRKLIKEQEEIREIYYNKKTSILPYTEAKKCAPVFTPDSFLLPTGFGEHNLLVKNLDIKSIIHLIDWTPFFHFWGFKGKYPEIIYTNDEAEKIYEAAVKLLGEIATDNSFEASLIVRFFDACTEDDTIVLDDKYRLPMLRQQKEGTKCLSLADFVKPKEQEGYSSVGLFCLKIEDKIKNAGNEKDFNSLLRDSVRTRCTEALAEWMQLQVSENLHLIRPAFGYSACPDHSLKKEVFEILDATEQIGVSLTSSYAMSPSSSLCGMLIAHPEAQYFSIDKVGEDQFAEYIQKRKYSKKEGTHLLGHIL